MAFEEQALIYAGTHLVVLPLLVAVIHHFDPIFQTIQRFQIPSMLLKRPYAPHSQQSQDLNRRNLVPHSTPLRVRHQRTLTN